MPITRTNKNRRTHKAKAGFTLIEVLIALIIMSVGMLGIAGLYVHSMQAGRTSLLRHHAVTLAGDVADRIRANPGAIMWYMSAGADNGCVDGGVDCTPAEMASHDIWLWDAQADSTLPDGTVTVVVANADPPTYTITVNWNEPGETMSYSIVVPVLDI